MTYQEANAFEKRTPEKPIRRKINVSLYRYKYKYQCFKCLATVSQYTDNYCPKCDWPIDWSEGRNETIKR